MNNQNWRTATSLWKPVFLGLTLALASLVAHAQVAIEAVSGSVQGGADGPHGGLKCRAVFGLELAIVAHDERQPIA